MKRLSFIVVVSALLLAAAGCSATRSVSLSEVDRITAMQIDDMLARRLYKIDFTRAFPVSAPSFSLSYPYYVSVIGDRVEVFLPYFGRAYSIPYGGGEGLDFEAPLSDYSETTKKNGRREITFTARTAEERYDFTLTVFPLGESNLAITPTNRQTISFSGSFDLEPAFEAVMIE